MTDYYMIRAMGQSDAEFKVFFDNAVVAMGWSDHDFSKASSPKAMADEIWEKYFGKHYAAPQHAGRKWGEVRRFCSLKAGDRVIVPCGPKFCMATVGEERLYDRSPETYTLDLSNQRRVQYLKVDGRHVKVPREELSGALQRRLRVRGLSILGLNEFSAELAGFFDNPKLQWGIRVLESREKQEASFKQTLLHRIQHGETALKEGGLGLESLVASLLEQEGYDVKSLPKAHFPEAADADLEATRSDPFSDVRLLVQVKHHWGESGSWAAQQLKLIRQLLPDAYKEHRLVVVTSAQASKQLIDECAAHDIDLFSGTELIDWIYECLPKLSAEERTRLGITGVPQLME